ncbi:MAG TPA: bifunctional precorrin-2 dehydrogenase/sirohydrochlorin ferrochelatase [Dehalococcoidia bacterium]|jgi:siroheme synthase-like protein|nr:bifunctional precorrin-2 dehydrogenase/sirohydrochlorin ferrochelatase [Dehalococcoidia bacterium]
MKKDQVPKYYPIFLNISGRRCVVVGGGEVALRKVRTLLEHGAQVEVISPELCSELAQLAQGGEIRAHTREYQAGDLEKAFIAIAATDRAEVNREIAATAHREGVLVNVVDDAESSDFIAPSYLHRGEVTIAISTAGRSPALARKIRTKLEEEVGDEYAQLARLIAEVRAEVKRQGITTSGDKWQEALDLDQLLDLVKKGEEEKAKNVLLSSLKALSQKSRSDR